MYNSRLAAYGSARNLQQKDALTKYRQIQRKFSRLKVIAYELIESWSIDVAYVDKLAKYINVIKY